MGYEASTDFGNVNTAKYTRGTSTIQKQISQEGINKLIYDVLSADQGLAALGGVESASGGFKSSSKSLLSQDLIAKLVGELANVTAPTVKTNQDYEDTNTYKWNVGAAAKGTVICTELASQGKLDLKLYSAGHVHFWTLPKQTVRGYHFWARSVVSLMQKSPLLSSLLAPIAKSRYEYIVHGKITFWGMVTVYIGQPVCYLIGTIVPDRYLPEHVSQNQ
jgi:hypothetical protein